MKRDKENILCPQVDLQPVIRAFHFLLRQLSRLLPFAHPLPVFSLLFRDNTAVDHNGFESSPTASYADTNEDAASRLPGKPGDTGVPAKSPGTGQEPGIYKPGALQINMQRFHQDQKNREEISTPGYTLLIEPHMHSMRFLTKYARDNFPGFDSFCASLPALEPEHQQPGMGSFILNRGSRGSRNSKESGVIKAFKNVQLVNQVVQDVQNQKQQTWPVLRLPFSLNVHSQEKNNLESTIINENKREYGIGLTPLHTVNRSLGFLNEVVQPTVIQVRLEEETKAISHPAAEKVHVNHVNHVNFLLDRYSRREAEVTPIQYKTGSQNTFQTSVRKAMQYFPLPAKHFLETRRVDTVPGVPGMYIRMRTYNITPSLTSLAFAGNYLHTRLMPSMSWNSNSYSVDVLSGTDPRPVQKFLSGEKVEKSTVIRKEHQGHGEEFFYKSSVSPMFSVVKNFLSHLSFSPLLKSLSFCNDYIQTHSVNPVSRDSNFNQHKQHNHMNTNREILSHRYHHYHYADVTAQLRAAEELHRHVHEYGHELSTAVIVEKIYKTQFANGSKGSDAGLNFRDSGDNQIQKVSNTFNVTMNVDKALSEVWDGDDLQDLGEKLTEILRDETRRYGIKI